MSAGSGSGSFQEQNCLGSLCSHDFKPNRPADSSPTTDDLVITPLGTPESRASQTAGGTAAMHAETRRTYADPNHSTLDGNPITRPSTGPNDTRRTGAGADLGGCPIDDSTWKIDLKRKSVDNGPGGASSESASNDGRRGSAEETNNPKETSGKDKIVGNTDTGVTNNYHIPGGQVVFNNYRDMSDPGEPTLQMFEGTGNDNEKPEVKENAVVKSQKSVLEDGRVMITQTFQNGAQGEFIVGEDKYQLRLANGQTSTFKVSAPNSALFRGINKGRDNENKENK